MRAEITLRLQQTGQLWFLSGQHENGTQLPPARWLRNAFIWHTSSFYGTFLTEKQHGGKTGIALTAAQALEYAAKLPGNSFLPLHYELDAALDQEAAKLLWSEYEEGQFLPDMEHWKEQLAWKPENVVIEQEEMRSLFSEAINEALATSSRSAGQWEKAKHLYEHREFSVKQLLTATDEGDWLRKIGFLADDTPFTMGLRLLEPHEDGAMWLLETILIPKKGAQRTYVYLDFSSLPKRWHMYHDRILSTHEGWGKLVPWLIDDVWRTELTEGEAWRFLTEASQELLAAGVEILLPSWWQALTQNSFSLRAKVKSDSGRGQSFFGMNTLVNFNWRISTNGVELSEEEFRQLVEQNRRLININGQWIRLDPAFIAQVKKLMDKADRYGLQMKDLLQQEFLRSGELMQEEDDNPFSEIAIELDNYYQGVLHRLTEIGEVPTVPVPEQLRAQLRPYQQKGVEWLLYLRSLGFGALLADDMGLGSAKRSHISVA